MPYRRTYPRFILNDSISVVTQEGREKHLLLKDLSAAGAGIFGDCSFNKDERVSVAINAPLFFDKPILKQARVAWSNQADAYNWEAGLELF